MKSYNNIYTIIKIYFLTIAIFLGYRLLLFISEFDRIDSLTSPEDIFLAFFMGIRFDIVIIGYILILPYLIMTYMTFAGENKILLKILFYYTLIMFSLAFLVCAADVPYFNHFFSRFSITAFEWFNSPKFVANMIIEESRYWLFIIPYIISIIILYIALRSIYFHKNIEINQPKNRLLIPMSAIFLLFILIGIRGRLDEKSPIRVGTAYFSNNPFLNQLGLNPNFTLMRSFLDAIKEENKPRRNNRINQLLNLYYH